MNKITKSPVLSNSPSGDANSKNAKAGVTFRIRSLVFMCPQCRKSPEVKAYKYDQLNLVSLKCKCHETNKWEHFKDALGDWIYWLDKKMKFDKYITRSA